LNLLPLQWSASRKRAYKTVFKGNSMGRKRARVCSGSIRREQEGLEPTAV